ncbi:ATP-dependent Clp protease proteolytic subunit [Candidatus Haliotispira prima]|uniref:ATP-dependent Clp protease proteolytic subunit n=1 Tax=Candidatus Haliotispira prima TaxID=3034016 RepID=A0ABY8MES1_9SPIO|nr:ATP-dependent Clp protease proteolytic subunit [Candidatus Haliotispira prima]
MPQTDEKNKKDDAKKSEEGLQSVLLKTRSIMLTGEINKEMTDRICKQLLYLNHESATEPVKMYIDSPGGDADAGYAIFDMIRFIEAPVYTIGLGLVASAGALVLIAPPKEQRLSMPNSHYMIHQPLSGIRGVASTIEIHAREVEKLRDRINHDIAEATGKKAKEVANDTDRDYWLSGEEAVEYGLVSRVVSNIAELRTLSGTDSQNDEKTGKKK